MGVNAIAGPIVPGSYTALPTVAFSGGGGSGATLTASYTVVSVAVTTAGAYSVLIQRWQISGNAQSRSVHDGNLGDGDRSGHGMDSRAGPSTVSFIPTGATAPRCLWTVVSVGATAPGSYTTTLPTVAIASGGGGSGATLSANIRAGECYGWAREVSCTTLPTPTAGWRRRNWRHAVTGTVGVAKRRSNCGGNGYTAGLLR